MRRLRFNFLFSVLFVVVANITAPTYSWAQVPVVWTDFVSTTVSSTTLLKTADFGWNAGAASVAKLEIGENGWVEYKVEEIGEKMLGLSSVNLNEDFTTIEYGIFSYYSTIKIIENGITKVSDLTYSLGDTLRIERLNNVIYYKRNGNVIYTSTKASTGELLVDVSLKRSTAQMSDVYLKKSINGDIADQLEFQALKALYESTDGANWTNNTGWPTSGNWPATATAEEMGNWFGINVDNGDIVALSLYNNNLTGIIPAEIGNLTSLTAIGFILNKLSGSIPTSLGELSNLEHLYLHYNNLTGPIPSQLGNLINLRSLYLYNNKLTGSIPVALGNLANLKWMFLAGNELSGAIPPELGNLTNLVDLKLQSNQLTGSIPASIGELINLKILFLHNNMIAGDIPPELGNLTNLISLQLHDNVLTGTIPPSLGNCTKLKYFYLRNANMSGPIPQSFENLTKLQVLFISNSGIDGVLPGFLGNLPNLYYIYLYGNKFTGGIPDNWQNLSNLQLLVLHNNQLSGTLPVWLKNKSTLTSLYLGNNTFTGSLTDFIGNWPNISVLHLAGLGLEGSIPESIGNLTSLQRLYLNNNSFTSFPDFTVNPNALNLRMYVQNNLIPYSMIEANLNTDGSHNFNEFSYSNQGAALPAHPTTAVLEGTQLVIDTHDASPNNTFVWEKQSGGNWANVTTQNENPTGDKYVKTATADDAGMYRYTVTNSIVNQTKPKRLIQ